MSFDISKLNGVTFNANAFDKIEVFQPGSTFNSSEIVVDSVGSYAGNANDPRNPGKITVVNSNYVPGGYDDSNYFQYFLPSFGGIQFDGVVDSSGNPITFYIHGFAENGLILSRYEVTGAGGSVLPGGGFDGGQAFMGNSYILSTYGFGLDGMRFPITFDKDPIVYTFPPVCFAEGTRLETVTGLVAVEDLSKGDMVITAAGIQRAVKWTGEMTVRPAAHPRPHEVNPVRVSAHAFGSDVPKHDVRLSPGHSVFVDGVLVPVGRLINGATIVQEAVERVRYFHVELESHDVLLAEGLPCESYLDDGNRGSFRNSAGFAEFYGRLDPKSWDDACAPLVADGPQLVQIRQRLHVQAEALGWMKAEDPALRIVAEGVDIKPLHTAGNRHWFAVPATSVLTLTSTGGVLSHVMPGISDGRSLGVAVSEVRVNGVTVDLDADAFGAGFYPLERDGSTKWRWTDGAGSLSTMVMEPAMIEVAVLMVAPSWRRRMPDLRIVA